MKDLGNRIRFERKALGLTLQNFADLIGNGSSMLQRVETGAKSPSIELLVEIANICRKPVDDLLKQKLNGFKKFDAHRTTSGIPILPRSGCGFHLPPFLFAGLYGRSAANKKIAPLRSLRLCGEYRFLNLLAYHV